MTTISFVGEFVIDFGLFFFCLQRKRKGPVPLPIEESQARRRATRARFREKKRAEKREAARKEAEKRQAEEHSKETAPSKKQNTAGGESEAKDVVNDGEEGSSESKKSPRVRKAVCLLSCLYF